MGALGGLLKREWEIQRLISLLRWSIVFFGISCSSQNQNTQKPLDQFIKAGNPNLVKTIGDESHAYQIVAKGAFRSQAKQGEINLVTSPEASGFLSRLLGEAIPQKPSMNQNIYSNQDNSDTTLLFGLRVSDLNQPMIFGGVVTQVSDHQNDDLGNLKLSDIPPFKVVPVINKDGSSRFVVSLMDCDGDCTQKSGFKLLINILISGVSQDQSLIYLDLSSLGQQLDLRAMYNDDSRFDRFKSKASKTVAFDYSKSTLIFDIEATLIDEEADQGDHQTLETVITNRWYLRSVDDLNPLFVSRPAVAGVGFFMTDNPEHDFIQRWDFDQRGVNDGIQYFIKHVPLQFQSAFAKAFDEWNEKLRPVIGKKIFSYEFIPDNDPRNDRLITGDVRYNILEWDLVNKASYGGLGPSIADQDSGQIFNSNILIQGPDIVDIYGRWFNIHEKSAKLKELGQVSEAELVIVDAQKEFRRRMKRLRGRNFQLKLGDRALARIRSQEPTFEDPIMSRDDFDSIPEGYSFENYMLGYFYNMATHELGHNLGLRHNFKGSLGASPELVEIGTVSRSVMEYLGRQFRHLDEIGSYDLMALSYGYLGIQPNHLDWFCTDEEALRSLKDFSKSAECMPNDATEDPFHYFELRLGHVMDLAIAKGQSRASEWTISDLKNELS